MYFEESELAKRMNDDGMWSAVIPDKGIVHLGGMATGTVYSAKKFSMFMESKTYYFRKHKGYQKTVLMKICYSLFHLVRPVYWKNIGSILGVIYKS